MGGPALVGALIFGATISKIANSGSEPRGPLPQADTHHYREGHRLTDLKVQYSSYGKVIPLVYGTVRIAGNVIWSRPLAETRADTQERSGHTVTHNTNYTYSATLAIALCKGPITGISRIWAESTQLDLSKLDYKLYLGDESQMPDPTIVSFEGQDKTPAYRGLAYVVIRNFPLAEYHDRIPNFTFEVRRHFHTTDNKPLEAKITNITFGQGIGERLYETVVQEKAAGEYLKGVTLQDLITKLSTKMYKGLPNDAGDQFMQIATPIIEEQAGGKNVISACVQDLLVRIKDEVLKQLQGEANRWNRILWRHTIHLVTQETTAGEYAKDVFIQRGIAQKLNQNNSSNKADALVALDDMKSVLPNVEWVSLPVYWVVNIKDGHIKPGVDFQDSRTVQVRPDEWQVASYIRETAHHVPDGMSTPSDSSILRTAQELKRRGYKVMLYPKLLQYDPEKNAFVNDPYFTFFPSEYQTFITHYAKLCGDHIDAFAIGSGPVATYMARVVNTINTEPSYVPYFKRLAAMARKELPNVKLIFAAFSNLYHSFNKQYYLDDLWSDSNIDVIGIESYFPLSESDGALTHEQVIEGWQSGEGWDYDYTDANRQEKTTLTKTSAWKNIRHWWENFHVNPDGKQTSWQPKMKPIWVTELAFGSVDGCTNEPEVFSNPHNKRYPRGSKGRTDFSAQRVALEGALDYLKTQEFIEQKFVNFWDPRPYPYYPSLRDRWLQPYTWSKDASLQGKLGLMMLNSIVQDLLQEVGLAEMCDVRRLDDMICGFVVSKRQSVRASLEHLASAYFFDAVESNGILNFTKRGSAPCVTIDSQDFIAPQNADEPSFIITREQELELPRSIDVIYISAAQFYETGTANAQRQTVGALNSESIELPIVLSAQDAQRIADVTMLQAWITRTQYKFSLPPKYMWLKPTDVITVHEHVEQQDVVSSATQDTRSGIDHIHHMRILAVKLMPNGVQEISAVAEDVSSYEYYGERNETAPRFTLPHPTPKTQLVLLDLPAITADDGAYLSCAAIAQNAGWRGAALYAAACGRDGPEMCGADCSYQGQIFEQATLGTVVAWNGGDTDSYTWDTHTKIDVVLIHGELFSTTEENTLAGANLCVIGDELLQFQKAEFMRDHHYRLSKLLRGRKGTESFTNNHTIGERFVLINSAIVKIPIPLACWGAARQYKAVTFGDPLTNTDAVEFTYNTRALKPYAPCHINAVRDKSGDLVISWIRRTRINGEWLSFVDAPVSEEAERYEVDVVAGYSHAVALAELGGAVKRTITGLTSPSAIYTKAQQLEDFGEVPTKIAFNVYQLSALVGRGYHATIVI